MIRFLEISNQTLFYYYLVCNLAYLAMLIIALKTTAAHQRQLQSVSLAWQSMSLVNWHRTQYGSYGSAPS